MRSIQYQSVSSDRRNCQNSHGFTNAVSTITLRTNFAKTIFNIHIQSHYVNIKSIFRWWALFRSAEFILCFISFKWYDQHKRVFLLSPTESSFSVFNQSWTKIFIPIMFWCLLHESNKMANTHTLKNVLIPEHFTRKLRFNKTRSVNQTIRKKTYIPHTHTHTNVFFCVFVVCVYGNQLNCKRMPRIDDDKRKKN